MKNSKNRKKFEECANVEDDYLFYEKEIIIYEGVFQSTCLIILINFISISTPYLL